VYFSLVKTIYSLKKTGDFIDRPVLVKDFRTKILIQLINICSQPAQLFNIRDDLPLSIFRYILRKKRKKRASASRKKARSGIIN